MRGVVALAFALFALSAEAQPYLMDGNAFYQRLLRQDASAVAYIFGVYDGIQIIQYHASSSERLVCAPAAVTGTELVDAVRGYLEADPTILDYPAGVLVLRALVWAFPCGKT